MFISLVFYIGQRNYQLFLYCVSYWSDTLKALEILVPAFICCENQASHAVSKDLSFLISKMLTVVVIIINNSQTLVVI